MGRGRGTRRYPARQDHHRRGTPPATTPPDPSNRLQPRAAGPAAELLCARRTGLVASPRPG
jgi:hypothetical protein